MTALTSYACRREINEFVSVTNRNNGDSSALLPSVVEDTDIYDIQEMDESWNSDNNQNEVGIKSSEFFLTYANNNIYDISVP